MKTLAAITFFIFILLITTSVINKDKPTIYGQLPIPTEFDKNRSKRKDFKQERKEYMRNMHRAHPNYDWEEMDKITRKLQTDRARKIRKELFISGAWNSEQKQIENISRDLSGYWQERGSNNLSGRIHTAEIDWENELIYCGSSGGNIWRGSLNGEDWISLTDYLQINGIIMLRIVNFGDTRRLLIGSNGYFYYTDDEGLTLEQSTGLDFLSDWGNVKRTILTENDNTIYLLSNEWDYSAWHEVAAIYKSTDYGASFTKILTLNSSAGMPSVLGASHYDIWTPRYFEDDVYLLHNDTFYRIIDSNELEYVANLPASGSGENILTGGMGINHPFLYAHIEDHIFFSMNGGTSWADRGVRPQWWFMINSFNSSNINQENIYWGGMEAFRSTNSGNSWDLVNNWWEYYGNEYDRLHADIPEIRFFLDPQFNEVALISTDGGLYFSDDELQTVQNLSLNGLGVSQYYSTYTKKTIPFNVYAGSQDQGFQRSINPVEGILNFEQSISGDYGHLVSGDDGETLWSNYPGFTMYYANPETDGGGLTLDFPGSGHLWLAPLMEDPYYSNKVYLGGGGLNGGNHLFHLTAQNGAISFDEGLFNFTGRVSSMGYSHLEPSHRYVLTDNGSFYHSSNDGNLWVMSSAFDGPDAHYFYGSTIWASETTYGKLIIGGSGYSNPPVYISYDHGHNFVALDEGLPNTLVYKLTGTPDDAYFFAATEIGPFVYIASQGEWVSLAGISAPDQTYWTVEYIPELNTARFGTYGRGIWDFVIDTEQEFLMGDLNADGILDELDTIVLTNIILGNLQPTPYHLQTGDINNNGSISIEDIEYLLQLIQN